MTVIVFDGKTLAADRRANLDGLHRSVTKIHRVGNLLVGGAGTFSFVNAMVEWVRAGRDPATFPTAQKDKDDWQPFLVVEGDGAILFYDRTPHPARFHEKVHAIGSGRDYALAALHLGKSAAEAVAVASHFDPHCGNGIDTLDMEA